MPLFAWRARYEIDIPEIDMQHRQLVGMINELFDAMKEDHGQQALHRILDRLLEYVPVHFETEERYMKNHNYPGLEDHLLEHMKLRSEVLELQDRRRNGERIATPELFEFLCDWLKEHISVRDKAFGEFLKQSKALLEG